MRRSPRKQIVRPLIVGMVAGAALNAAIVWVPWPIGRVSLERLTGPGSTDWPAAPPRGWPDHPESRNRMRSWVYEGDMGTAAIGTTGVWLECASWGWPCRAVGMDLYDDGTRTRLRGGLPTYIVNGEQRYMPLRPLWTGLAVNMMLYGTLCAAAVEGVLWWRRRGRRMRGECQFCGYPATPGAGVCPECGRKAEVSGGGNALGASGTQ